LEHVLEIATRKWQRTAVREASRSHALDSPMPGECRKHERPGKRRSAPTDAVRARHFAAGQALGKAVYEEHKDVDGFIYASRLTGDDCIAVFDRGVGKLRVIDACELKDHMELPGVLERNGVTLVDWIA
jgi:RES domain